VDEASGYNAGYVDSLLPMVNSHDITEAIIEESLYIYTPMAQGLQTLDEIRSTLEITSLLNTSDESYSLTDGGESANTTGVIEQGENDPSGPFSVGMIITEPTADDETRVALYSTQYMIIEYVTQNNSVANISLFVNTLKWICGSEDGLTIDSKNLQTDSNIISSAEMISWGFIFVILLPVVAIIVGLVIWIKRRRA
jgi:ABC-type uncharacterized transport system involved in gliding motility auxiliary subunit